MYYSFKTYKMNNLATRLLPVIVFQVLMVSTILSQKITSGLIETGFIDMVIVDTTQQALEDAIFFKQRIEESQRKEYLYFNKKYQVEIDTLSDNKLVSKYLDIENGLKYIYYDSSNVKLFAIDSIIYQFDRDEVLKKSRDSLTIDFEKQKRNQDTVQILGYNCLKIAQSKFRRNEEGYFYFFLTEDLGTNYMKADPIRYCKGYPMRFVIAIENNLEMIVGVKKISYIPPDNAIFTKPNFGYVQISFDEIMNKIYP